MYECVECVWFILMYFCVVCDFVFVCVGDCVFVNVCVCVCVCVWVCVCSCLVFKS